METETFFTGIHLHIAKSGISARRVDLLVRLIEKHGGNVHEILNEKVTHVIVDDAIDTAKLAKVINTTLKEGVKVVKSMWVTESIKAKKLEPSESFEIYISKKENVSDKESQTTLIPAAETKRRKVEEEHVVNSSSEDESEPSCSTSNPVPVPGDRKLPKGSWVCAQASSQTKLNHNQHVTEQLEKMAQLYESTKDKWRALGYQKAISALKNYAKEITTWEEARSIRGVGDRLADKIWEIIQHGQLTKLKEMGSREDVAAIQLFTNIWGAGPTTAQLWVAQGFRTLDDLRTKANLTRQQRIGLQHYDDFLDRMPREEAGQIEATVRETALSIQPGLIAEACGSYRREKSSCGDVDVLVTHPDGKSHRGVFHALLEKLRQQGFVTDDLVTQEDNGNQRKYLGVCKLPGDNQKYRRLDIIVVPYSEYACALMYFTGSAHFNRSMRNLAGKMGMSLSEHSLNVGVIRRNGEKINNGTPLPTPTEESVFQHLGIPYRTPKERDH